MKVVSAKVTYSVDPLTVMEVRELATAWGVTRSEVIRRAIHAAASHPDALGRRPITAEEALDQLQSEPRLAPAASRKWAEGVREERRATRRPTP
jgi:hypothetical protein